MYPMTNAQVNLTVFESALENNKYTPEVHQKLKEFFEIQH
jgi:hypothetical protein